MRSVSRGDTKKVCLLFNSLLPPVKSEKGERERRERERREREKCLSLLKNTLFLSLFLFSSFSFFLRYVLAVDSFFFSSLLHFYSWVKSSVGLLSLFPLLVFGGRSDKHIRSSLSLSSKKRAFWKTPTKPDDLPERCVKREILVFERSTPEDSFARERSGRKKKRWIGFLLSLRHEPQPHRGEQSRQRDENAYIREQICARVCVVPCVRPRGACLQNSFFRRFTIYVCVYILRKERSLFDTRVRIYIYTCCVRTRESKRAENVTRCVGKKASKSFH